MTKELEQAILAYWGPRCPSFDPDCPCCKSWAAFDAVSRCPVPGVTVKPLIWNNDFWPHTAQSIAGFYAIHGGYPAGLLRLCFGTKREDADKPGCEIACGTDEAKLKDTAQAHYERCILSAINTSTAPTATAEAGFPQPDRNRAGQEACGECRIQPGETCDICGASNPAHLTTAGAASDEVIPVHVMPKPDAIHYMDTRTRADPHDVVAIATDQSSRAIGDVLDERRRQLQEEGWSADHDDQHRSGELAVAAACYALNSSDDADGPEVRFQGAELWPWADEWWKPKDRRRDLVRAAALMLAEIERLDRAALRRARPLLSDVGEK